MASSLTEVSDWFRHHVTLDGQPYTLDADQTRAVMDQHLNTLVTARAGSGKTRVIVAKVAYLVAHCQLSLPEIAIFMFNRTAAAEVNQRIARVEIDHQPLVSRCETVRVASTFHKFALDMVKLAGEQPKLISEAEHQYFVREALGFALDTLKRTASPTEQREFLSIVNGFIARAGQSFPGRSGYQDLSTAVGSYCFTLQDYEIQFYHALSLLSYKQYLAQIVAPATDFNLLMDRATTLLQNPTPKMHQRLSPLKYIMIDEYQDFSYLFFALTSALRGLAPQAHLFAVGDDWQAINRFAGSDVDYFINFAEFFPEDCINIPLATNYRSARCIVERANHFMLTHYDPKALPAQAFSHARGQIEVCHPERLKFDPTDIQEDGLGDGRYLRALARTTSLPANRVPLGAAKLLKQLVKIIRHHRHSQIMLLHRHNFTSFTGITLDHLQAALRDILTSENYLTLDAFSSQIRFLTMHKSKGLESSVVILLELDRAIVAASHPHATIFKIFGDTRAAEVADQKRLLYVAMTRAKQKLYILTSDQQPLI